MKIWIKGLLICLLTVSGFVKSDENMTRLVVLHDDTFTIRSKAPSKTDLLAESLLSSLASSFDLSLFTYKINFKNAFFSIDWGSFQFEDHSNVAAIVGIGDCAVNNKVASLALRVRVSILAVNTKPCKDSKTSESGSVPAYLALDSRKFQCMAPEVRDWILQTKGGKNHRVLGRNLTTRNHYAEYLECIGPKENLEILRSSMGSTVSPGIPFSMQLEQGKRFLNGREMVIVTINRPPFISLTMEGEKIVNAKGFCITMLDVLADKFNFTYRLVLPYDGNWGNPMKNGTFNGMVGMVHRMEVDFAVAGFTITQIRDTVIDFTHAFYEEPTTILIPPPKEENKLLAFLSPFSWEVWTSLLLIVGIISPLMWTFASKCVFLPLLYPFHRQKKRPPLHRYFWECAFTLVAQSNKMRQTFPARVLLGVWWMVNIIIIYTYTSTLIAFLTVPKLQSLIDSLEALGNQREILWTYRAGTAHERLFGEALPPGTYHKIGQLIREHPHLKVTTDYEGIRMVLTNNMAFIKEKSWLDFAMEEDYLQTGKCRLSQVHQLFFSAGFGWVLQEESIYLSLFNREILRMMQSGLFAEWKRRFWPKPNECSAGGGAVSGPKALQVKNLYGHFLILGVGFFLSLLTLFIERFLNNSSGRQPVFTDFNGKLTKLK